MDFRERWRVFPAQERFDVQTELIPSARWRTIIAFAGQKEGSHRGPRGPRGPSGPKVVCLPQAQGAGEDSGSAYRFDRGGRRPVQGSDKRFSCVGGGPQDRGLPYQRNL